MADSSRPTLQEIARKARVSVASVSYALNGKGRLSPQQRQKLEKMLREAGLKPRHRRYPVLYLYRQSRMSDVQAYQPLIEKYTGINEVLNRHEISLRLELIQEESHSPLAEQLASLDEARPGAVVLDSDLDEMLGGVARFFSKNQVPVIQLGHTVRQMGFEAVVVDNFGGGQLAAQYLIERGHKRIGVIRWWSRRDPASAEKFAGFVGAMQQSGLELNERYVVETAEKASFDQPLPGRDAAEKLLSLPDPPTAVFVENSFVSPSLIYPNSLEDRSMWQRLREIEMVHFEAWHTDWMDAALSQKLHFPQRDTTLLRIDWKRIGKIAAERLVARLDGEDKSGETVRLMPRLVAVRGAAAEPVQVHALTGR